MALQNPNNSSEILYGSSGDVRNEINAFANPSFSGHYVDELEVPGISVIRGLERATRLINTYLEVVYADQIPYSATGDVPPFLDDLACDLATYFVWRSNTARLSQISDEKKAEYYDEHVKEKDGTLPKLRDRKMQLIELTASYGDEVQAVRDPERAPIFDVDEETNWRVDPNLIEDIQHERDS